MQKTDWSALVHPPLRLEQTCSDEFLVKEGLRQVAAEFRRRTLLTRDDGKSLITQRHLSQQRSIIHRCQHLVEDPTALRLMMIASLKQNLSAELTEQGISIYDTAHEQVQLWRALNKEELFLKEGIRVTKPEISAGIQSSEHINSNKSLNKQAIVLVLCLILAGVLVMVLTGCVVSTETVEEGDVTFVGAPLPTPTVPHKEPSPDHESCASLYQEGINGQIVEIPVECHPFVVDPYSQPIEELPLPEEEAVLEQL